MTPQDNEAGVQIPNVYTPSLMAKNEAIALTEFDEFIANSKVAQDMTDDQRIEFFLESKKNQQNGKRK